MRGRGRGIEGEAAPAADADDADALRIDVVAHEQAIDRGTEVVGADLGRGEAARFAAALAAERRVEGQRQESPLGKRLGIEARHLLLHGAVGAADSDGGQAAGRSPGL